MNTNKKYFQILNGVFRVISKSDVDLILNNYSTSEFSVANSGSRHYLLPDGRVLRTSASNAAAIYASKDIMMKFVYGDGWELNVVDKNFISDIPGIIEKISQYLLVEESGLTYNMASLKNLDAIVRDTIGVRYIQNFPIFDSFVAYVGEVVRRSKGGVWQVEWDVDEEKYIAKVITNSGERIEVQREMDSLYSEMYENNFSLFSLATFLLNPNDLRYYSQDDDQ